MIETLAPDAVAIPISRNWPVLSLGEIESLLCAPGGKFEFETVMVGGVPTKVWKHAPANLAEIARLGASHGDATFIVYEDERVSFDGWFRAVAAMAAHLQSLGVGKGDRVALAMRNLPEWPVTFFAVTTLGAICVPLNAWWTGGELAYGLSNSGAKVLVCDAERLERIAPHRAELPALEHVIVARLDEPVAGVTRIEDAIGQVTDYARLPQRDLPEGTIAPDDPATILYTSGTTGNPKGARGSHRNLHQHHDQRVSRGAFVAAARRSTAKSRRWAGQENHPHGDPAVPRHRVQRHADGRHRGRPQDGVHAPLGHRPGVRPDRA